MTKNIVSDRFLQGIMWGALLFVVTLGLLPLLIMSIGTMTIPFPKTTELFNQIHAFVSQQFVLKTILCFCLGLLWEYRSLAMRPWKVVWGLKSLVTPSFVLFHSIASVDSAIHSESNLFHLMLALLGSIPLGLVFNQIGLSTFQSLVTGYLLSDLLLAVKSAGKTSQTEKVKNEKAKNHEESEDTAGWTVGEDGELVFIEDDSDKLFL